MATDRFWTCRSKTLSGFDGSVCRSQNSGLHRRVRVRPLSAVQTRRRSLGPPSIRTVLPQPAGTAQPAHVQVTHTHLSSCVSSACTGSDPLLHPPAASRSPPPPLPTPPSAPPASRRTSRNTRRAASPP